KTVLGANTVIADNQVQFKGTDFTLKTNDEIIRKLGPTASLDATMAASFNRTGIESAQATAALKWLVGNTQLDTTGTSLSMKDNSVDKAQLQLAAKTIFGPNAKLSSDGKVTWDRQSGPAAEISEAFKGSFEALSVDAEGNLNVKRGHVS